MIVLSVPALSNGPTRMFVSKDGDAVVQLWSWRMTLMASPLIFKLWPVSIIHPVSWACGLTGWVAYSNGLAYAKVKSEFYGGDVNGLTANVVKDMAMPLSANKDNYNYLFNVLWLPIYSLYLLYSYSFCISSFFSSISDSSYYKTCEAEVNKVHCPSLLPQYGIHSAYLFGDGEYGTVNPPVTSNEPAPRIFVKITSSYASLLAPSVVDEEVAVLLYTVDPIRAQLCAMLFNDVQLIWYVFPLHATIKAAYSLLMPKLIGRLSCLAWCMVRLTIPCPPVGSVGNKLYEVYSGDQINSELLPKTLLARLSTRARWLASDK